MEIMITDRFKLKRVDEMNMRLYELGETVAYDRPRNRGGRPTGEVRREWKSLDAYFQDIPSAVAFVYRKMQRDDEHTGDLESALLRMERIKDELIAGVTACRHLQTS